MTTVFATDRATRFHETASCQALVRAQELNDFDCGCDTYCTHILPRLWRIVERPISEAVALGKRPCWACYRGKQILPPSTETFGHVPVDEYAGTPEGARGVSRIVCARCTVWTPLVGGLEIGSRVSWPCTSALILGIAPRPS